MDEATKAGYGVLLMRQALPKSEFYARTTANIRAGLQEPAPGPADTIPFGVLGRGPTRKPLDLAKDAHVAALAARLDSLHGATAQAAARGMPRSDGLDEATLALYAKLTQLLDADPIGKIEALRTEQRQAVAEAKAARAQGAQVLKRAEQMELRLDRMESTISQTVTDAIQAQVSTRIDAIASELKTVPGAVSRMESELNAAKGTIGGLVDDVKALKDDKEKMLDAAKSMEAAALLAAPREDSLRAEVAMLAERIEELRTASNGVDVLQAVENLRTELRPPEAPQPTRSDSPPTSRLSRQSAFDASVASSQRTQIQRHDAAPSEASSHVGASADLGAHTLGASAQVSDASQDLVRMDSVSAHASVEAELKSPLADAISRAAADRRKDARPIFLQDTPAKDAESTGPPAWMCDSSLEGGGSLISGTPRAGSDSSRETPPIPEEEAGLD
ncbi:unnamed protein product [Pelagomonas calceolata]|uniref:Uncharacterized protein n=1 Tax=Pelagomonas calceolata TaxID=35677 RepID=A0A7S4EC00_9STRA|nr:unnamed protein product [Pelagomonas calceolata]